MPILPSEHKFLLDYLLTVRKHYQYIELLDTGVDTRARAAAKPTSDRLYITPNFLNDYVDPQVSEEHWKDNLLSFDQVIQQQKRLFVLGDPGTGKTTLAQRLAFIFSERYPRTEKSGQPPYVPFLLTLRSLDYSQLDTWEDLIWAMFRQPQYRNLWADPDRKTLSEEHQALVRAVFAAGQAFVLLDGLDEIHQPKLRATLSRLIREGMLAYPEGYWWITTRIIGFSERRFWYGKKRRGRPDRREFLETREKPLVERQAEDEDVVIVAPDEDPSEDFPQERLPLDFYTRYLAPFTKAQIRQFMGLWYSYFEERTELHEGPVEHFCQSLETHPQPADHDGPLPSRQSALPRRTDGTLRAHGGSLPPRTGPQTPAIHPAPDRPQKPGSGLGGDRFIHARATGKTEAQSRSSTHPHRNGSQGDFSTAFVRARPSQQRGGTHRANPAVLRRLARAGGHFHSPQRGRIRLFAPLLPGVLRRSRLAGAIPQSHRAQGYRGGGAGFLAANERLR
ncbi:MAG: NACHT domain-containing protein [Bacteroidota bacterium]